MPVLHRYSPGSNKDGFFVKLSHSELRQMGIMAVRFATHQVEPDGNRVLEAMGFKDGDTLERPLYWMLRKRRLITAPNGTASGPDQMGHSEWAEICAMVEARTRVIALGDLVRWLRLTPAEVRRLENARARSGTSPIPVVGPASVLKSAESRRQTLGEFRRARGLSRSEAARQFKAYLAGRHENLALVATSSDWIIVPPERTTVEVSSLELRSKLTGESLRLSAGHAIPLLLSRLAKLEQELRDISCR